MRALRHAIVEAAAVLAFAPHINLLGSICIVSSLSQMRTTCVFFVSHRRGRTYAVIKGQGPCLILEATELISPESHISWLYGILFYHSASWRIPICFVGSAEDHDSSAGVSWTR